MSTSTTHSLNTTPGINKQNHCPDSTVSLDDVSVDSMYAARSHATVTGTEMMLAHNQLPITFID